MGDLGVRDCRLKPQTVSEEEEKWKWLFVLVVSGLFHE